MAKKRTKKTAAEKTAAAEKELAKASPPERLLAALRAKFDPRTAILMGGGGLAKVEAVCPTGVEVIDRHLIGIGGLPYGQITELYGDESTGKTTLLAKIMGAAQRDGCVVAFGDAETKFVDAWGELQGMNLADVVQLDCQYLEKWQEKVDFCVDHTPKGKLMIALDSIASLQTKSEYERKGGGQGEHARVWTEWGRQFKRRVWEKQVLVVWLNQPRSKIGVMYGPNETTFGGRWLRHAPLIRIHVNHGKGIVEDSVKVGKYVNLYAEKNQLAPQSRKAALRLLFDRGFDDDWATLNHAKEMGCIEESASFIPKNVREARANLGWPARVEAPIEPAVAS